MREIKKMTILRWGTVILAFAMIVSFVNGWNIQAADSSDNLSLSKTSISVKEGMTGKTTVKNNKPVYPKHKPYGKGVGAKPGRVVWSHNPKSVQWDGKGYWWETHHFNEKVITKMFRNSIASLGGTKKAKTGWTKLFQAQNKRRGKGNQKYKKGEKIAIKANINGSGVFDDDDSGKTKMSYTNPVLLKVLLTSLVKDAGVAPSDITVYDVSRIFPVYMMEMCTKGELKGVHFVGRDNGVADKKKPFLSQDPVAIDSVGADFLMNEPTVTNHNDSLKNNATVENYLHEAALIKKAPSGNVYKNGNGEKVTNLGVHEHWNNPVSKKYSRNLGKKEGIELIMTQA